MSLPRCIKCKHNDQVYEDGDRNFWCRRCHVGFSPPEPGDGDYSDWNPAARLEREERRAARSRMR